MTIRSRVTLVVAFSSVFSLSTLGLDSRPVDTDPCGLTKLEIALESNAEARSHGNTKELHREASRLVQSSAAKATSLLDSPQKANCSAHLARFCFLLGRTAKSLGQVAEAEFWLTQAHGLHRTEFGESAPVLADILDDLSTVHYLTHRADSGLELLEQAFELRRSVLPPDDPRIAKSLIDLGAACQIREEIELAENYYRRGIEVLERSAEKNAKQLGGALLMLAELLKNSGETEEVKALIARGSKLSGF